MAELTPERLDVHLSHLRDWFAELLTTISNLTAANARLGVEVERLQKFEAAVDRLAAELAEARRALRIALPYVEYRVESALDGPGHEEFKREDRENRRLIRALAEQPFPVIATITYDHDAETVTVSEPRTERCVRCGIMTADWVDPDGAPGRLCRECETAHITDSAA